MNVINDMYLVVLDYNVFVHEFVMSICYEHVHCTVRIACDQNFDGVHLALYRL